MRHLVPPLIRSVRPRRRLASSLPSKPIIFRHFSQATASRDGRRRFYVNVDVAPCPPVWEDSLLSSTVNSPISAGVDGTDSASGVTLRSQNDEQERLKHWLLPRRPGVATPENSSPSWHCVRLDGRPLRTPLGHNLAVPSETLAYAIAAEWNCQVVESIRPVQMPLMTLVSTAIDQTTNAAITYQEQVLRFLKTDTVCYWADPVEDRSLYRRQEAAWKDLHAWVKEWSGGHAPAVATGHEEGMWLAKGTQLPHPPGFREACEEFVQSLDAWHLAAMNSIASEAKSFCIALALINDSNNGVAWSMDVQGAQEAARIEEEFSIENWGLVEGAHDYDRLNCSVQLHAALLLKDCLAMGDQ